MDEREFGSMVKAPVRLVRNKLEVEGKRISHWVEINDPVEGLLTGFRYIQDGETVFNPEHGYRFETKEVRKAGLVTPGPRSKPVYVPYEELIVV